MRRILMRLGVGATTVAIALSGGVALAQASVDPASVSTTLASGTSTVVTKTVHTPAIPPKIDIVFLADTTGSMGGAITNVQTNASSIMSQVRTAQPDSQFGAASYKDPDGCDAVPFSVDQTVTTNTVAVQTGINTWAAIGGCDTPEGQLNALYNLATGAAGFRSGSTRVIAWFGDSSGHDPSNGHSLAQTIAALQAANVIVLAVPVTGGGDGLDSTGQATAIASATGGDVLPSATPSQVAARILTGLQNLPVTVTPTPTCDSGLSATYDFANLTVTSGDDAVFQETLTVAGNAPDGGTLHCTVDFLLNGIHQDGFQQSVAIDVPLRNADLSITKSASPTHLTEGNNVTYTLAVTNGGTDPNTNVVATDNLPNGEAFVSSADGCTASTTVVTCNFGTVAAGATVAKSFVASVPLGAPSSITNTAGVTGDRPDNDTTNNSATATITVNHNPVCTNLSGGPNLWPPNHKLVRVTPSGATDTDGNTLTYAITGVTQDEALNGLGDGDTSPDAVAGTAGNVWLRAERSGTGDGRVYAVHVTVTDGDGGACSGIATVGVPHDQGHGSVAVDSGQTFIDY